MSGPIIPIWLAVFFMVGLAIPIAGAIVAIFIGLFNGNHWFIAGGIVGGFFYWLTILRRFI